MQERRCVGIEKGWFPLSDLNNPHVQEFYDQLVAGIDAVRNQFAAEEIYRRDERLVGTYRPFHHTSSFEAQKRQFLEPEVGGRDAPSREGRDWSLEGPCTQ